MYSLEIPFFLKMDFLMIRTLNHGGLINVLIKSLQLPHANEGKFWPNMVQALEGDHLP